MAVALLHAIAGHRRSFVNPSLMKLAAAGLPETSPRGA